MTMLSYNVVVGQGHYGHCNQGHRFPLYIAPKVLINGTPGKSYCLRLLFPLAFKHLCLHLHPELPTFVFEARYHSACKSQHPAGGALRTGGT
jgi:hypothetical protein